MNVEDARREALAHGAETVREAYSSLGLDWWALVRRPQWEDRLNSFAAMNSEIRAGAQRVIRANRVRARQRDSRGRWVQ